MVNIKFKALYACECSKLSDNCDRAYSIVFAVISASSIAAWAIWQQYPKLWAIIAGVGQVLQIARPYIPFFKNSKSYLESSFEYELLYLEYEKLWNAIERYEVDERTCDEKFYQFRQRHLEIDKSHKEARCPRLKRLTKNASEQTLNTLKMNFVMGG